MAPMTLKTWLAVGFPAELVLGGGHVLSDVSGRAAAANQLTLGKEDAPKPLNLRWFGYGKTAAKEYWDWLTCVGRHAEEKFLILDLLFPLVYGGALAASLWWVWATLGRPFHGAWIAVPLAMILTADWTENLIQLVQLRHYLSSHESRIQNVWIQVSSCATVIKLWFTSGLYLSLAGLVVRMILMYSNRHLATDAAE